MSVYEFLNHVTFSNVDPRGFGGVSERAIITSTYPDGVSQLSDIQEGRIPILWERDTVEAADVEEFLEPGLHYLDEAMQMYWSDIRIPTKDSSRFIRVRVSGGSKSLQVWTEDLKHGRVQLPVIAISRTGDQYNPAKFSPAYMPIQRRFVDNDHTRIRLIYRPVPCFVDYKLTIAAEFKRDLEYALFQIRQRFNPLVEFTANDRHQSGQVQVHYTGTTDTSDKEIDAEQQAKFKYEVSIKAEAWTSLPTVTAPAILGQTTVHNLTGASGVVLTEGFGRFN